MAIAGVLSMKVGTALQLVSIDERSEISFGALVDSLVLKYSFFYTVVLLHMAQ